MFNKLAIVDAGRVHAVPALSSVPHNDNRPDGRASGNLGRSQRLVCHWRAGATGGHLECYWQIEPADETEAAARSFMIGTVARAVRRAVPDAATQGLTDGRAA